MLLEVFILLLDINFVNMCNRHKTPRVYVSVAGRWKFAEERKMKEVEIISKVPKISEYFITLYSKTSE